MSQLITPFAGIAVFIILFGILPIACSNKLTLSSLSDPSVNTNGANICEENPTPTPGIPPNGINWASATVQLQSSGGFSVSIPLVVNGTAITNAAVTFSGPGLTVPVPYYGTMVFSGTTYADYVYGNQSVNLIPGAIYTLTTTTTIGTASASLAVPNTPTLNANDSILSWTGSNSFNEAGVEDSATSTTTYLTSQCISINSPVSIPTSAYPTTDTAYTIGVLNYNFTQSITGGTGSFWMEEQTDFSVQK